MDHHVINAIAQKELLDILSEKVYWMAFLLELIIVLGVILLGIAFAAMMNPIEMASNSPDVRIRIGLLDLSGSVGKHVVVDKLREENVLLVFTEDEGTLREDVRNGDLMGGLVLPREYREDLVARMEAQLIIDPTKVYASVARAKVERAVDATNEKLAEDRMEHLGLKGEVSFSISQETMGDPVLPIESPDFVEAMYLMVIPLVLIFPILLAANMTSDSIVGEKETGTLGILMSAPVSRFDIVAGKILPVLGLANLQFVAWIVLLEHNLLGPVPVFNELTLLLILNLGALSLIGAALLISSRSSSSKESNLYLTLLIISCIFPLFVGIPEMVPAANVLESMFLVKAVGYMAASPFVPMSTAIWTVIGLGSVAVCVLLACLRSLRRLEPPPSR